MLLAMLIVILFVSVPSLIVILLLSLSSLKAAISTNKTPSVLLIKLPIPSLVKMSWFLVTVLPDVGMYDVA